MLTTHYLALFYVNRDLYLLFRRHGTILSVHTMVNKITGLSKGYGFVSFADKDDAQAAIEQMNGFQVNVE